MSTSTESERGQQSFAEAALRLSGKTDEEARRTGAVDKADEQVEALFAPQYQTVNSPVHKAVWDGHVPLTLFAPPPLPPSASCDVPMQKSLEIVKRPFEGVRYVWVPAGVEPPEIPRGFVVVKRRWVVENTQSQDP